VHVREAARIELGHALEEGTLVAVALRAIGDQGW
jgi:hypothetical protein